MTGKTRATLRDLHNKFMVEQRPVEPRARRRLYITAAFLIVVPLAFFAVILGDVLQRDDLSLVDRPVQDWLQSGRSEFWTAAWTGLSVFFGPIMFPFVALIVTLVWSFTARHIWRPLLLALGTLTCVVSVRLIAEVVDRDRPPLGRMLLEPDLSASFPSGHVVGASAFVLLLVYLVFSRRKNPRSAVLAFVLAALCIVATSTSRIYLGYHWVTDTLAAICLALVVLGAVIAIDTRRSVLVPGERRSSTELPVEG